MLFARLRKVRHAFRKLLMESPEIAAMVGDRVSSRIARKEWTTSPQNYIVFKVSDNEGVRTLMGQSASLWGTRVTVLCYGVSGDAADDLADIVSDYLEQVSINTVVTLPGGETLKFQAVSMQEDLADADAPVIHAQNRIENCSMFSVLLWHEG